MKAFAKFDRDEDHELEQEEFKEFVEEMRWRLASPLIPSTAPPENTETKNK